MRSQSEHNTVFDVVNLYISGFSNDMPGFIAVCTTMALVTNDELGASTNNKARAYGL